MSYSYERQAANEFVQAALEQGLRPFLAERGTYGFFTDAEGKQVVGFQADFGTISLGGNYITENARRTGAGWGLGEWTDSMKLRPLLTAQAPRWAHQGFTWRHTTLEEHLAQYQRSSKYTEITEEVSA